MAYCTQAELYQFGLPHGAVPNPGRLACSVSSATNAIRLGDHGFSADDIVVFRAEAGGSLPSPLAESTEYFAIPDDDSTFGVALTAGGSRLDLTTQGSRVLVIAPLPVASALEWASKCIDEMLPAHVVPLASPYPEIVSMTCAELAAWKLLARGGVTSKTITEVTDAAQKRLARWAKGIPVRGTPNANRANTAITASAPSRDTRGWRRFGGL